MAKHLHRCVVTSHASLRIALRLVKNKPQKLNNQNMMGSNRGCATKLNVCQNKRRGGGGGKTNCCPKISLVLLGSQLAG